MLFSLVRDVEAGVLANGPTLLYMYAVATESVEFECHRLERHWIRQLQHQTATSGRLGNDHALCVLLDVPSISSMQSLGDSGSGETILEKPRDTGIGVTKRHPD